MTSFLLVMGIALALFTPMHFYYRGDRLAAVPDLKDTHATDRQGDADSASAPLSQARIEAITKAVPPGMTRAQAATVDHFFKGHTAETPWMFRLEKQDSRWANMLEAIGNHSGVFDEKHAGYHVFKDDASLAFSIVAAGERSITGLPSPNETDALTERIPAFWLALPVLTADNQVTAFEWMAEFAFGLMLNGFRLKDIDGNIRIATLRTPALTPLQS